MPKKNQSRIAEQELPEIKEGLVVCRVGIARGGSQFEMYDGEDTWVAELPKRFRNTIWIRRGSFVLVDTSNRSTSMGGICGEIVFVIQRGHISQLRKQDHWPPQLDETQETLGTVEASKGESVDEGASHQYGEDDANFSDSELFQNNNRR